MHVPILLALAAVSADPSFWIQEAPVSMSGQPVCFFPDGKSILVRDREGIAAWELASRKPRARLKLPDVGPCAVSPDGCLVAVGGKQLHLVDWPGGKQHKLESKQRTFDVCFSSDGTRLLSSHGELHNESDRNLKTKGASVCLWDVATGKCLLRVKPKQTEAPILGGAYAWAIRSARLAPDGKSIAARLVGVDRLASMRNSPLTLADLSSHLLVWNTDGKLLHDLPATGWGDSVRFSPDGKILYASGWISATAWDLATSKKIRSFDWPEKAKSQYGDQFERLEVSPDGALLLSYSWLGVLRTWDTTTGKESGSALDCGGVDGAMLLSPSGSWLLTRGQDTRLWRKR